jgi:hypothetical protein
LVGHDLLLELPRTGSDLQGAVGVPLRSLLGLLSLAPLDLEFCLQAGDLEVALVEPLAD